MMLWDIRIRNLYLCYPVAHDHNKIRLRTLQAQHHFLLTFLGFAMHTSHFKSIKQINCGGVMLLIP